MRFLLKKIYSRLLKLISFSCVKKDPNPVRWGIIGLGYMAETFSSTIDGNKGGIVYAVASRSAKKAQDFAARHGRCKSYGSYEELINDKNLELDIIYIATPVKYHYEHVKLCLNAGKNVLCEKPLTSSFEQLSELISIAKRNGCFLMEGMWMQCLPSFRKAVEWINLGKIGKVELIKIDFYKREHIRESYAIYNRQEGGGILRDFGVYAIAFMSYFLRSYPSRLYTYSRESIFGIDADWQISASANGMTALVNLSSNFGSLSKAAVIGSNGFIEWDSQFNRTRKVSLYNAKGERLETYEARYKHEGFEYEVDEAQYCVRNGLKESRLVPLWNTQTTLKIVDELMRRHDDEYK